MTTHQRVLYWQVIHRDFSLDDAVISRVIQPVMTQNCQPGTWHYLRYFDERGPHVRVRLFTEDASEEKALLDTITAGLEARLRSTLDSSGPGDYRATSVYAERNLQLPSTRDAGVRICLYEPEMQKYGGAGALRAAERIWNTSTREALHHLDPAWTPTSRLAHAAADAYLATRHFFAHDFEAIRSFWTVYARFWSGGDQNRLAALPEDATLHDLLPELEERTETPATLRSSWPAQLAQMCESEATMLNHQLHLHNNRLGVSPGDEAALAVLILLVHRAHAVRGGSGGRKTE